MTDKEIDAYIIRIWCKQQEQTELIRKLWRNKWWNYERALEEIRK